MKSTFSLGAAFLAISLLPACNQYPAEGQARAREAQRRAEDAGAEERRLTKEQAVQTQAKADHDAWVADRIFTKARARLEVNTSRKIGKLSDKIDELAVKAERARNADALTIVKELAAERAALKQDLRALASTNAEDFDAWRTNLTERVESLEKSVEQAAAKI